MKLEPGVIVKVRKRVVRVIGRDSGGQWICDDGRTYSSDRFSEPSLEEVRKKILEDAERDALAAEMERISPHKLQ